LLELASVVRFLLLLWESKTYSTHSLFLDDREKCNEGHNCTRQWISSRKYKHLFVYTAIYIFICLFVCLFVCLSWFRTCWSLQSYRTRC
jgi:hypothetical protein